MRKADLRKINSVGWILQIQVHMQVLWPQRHGKPFTDRECMKESHIKISEHLPSDFESKSEIVQKIWEMPLCEDCQRWIFSAGGRGHLQGYAWLFKSNK